ncbi:MAG: hypothetical protein IJ849_05710 [Selenomonadaceae bacterium]|nr:hypothetical protein [Selenomonadaceae bacterium]
MTVKYIAKGSPLSCINGKSYPVVAVEPGPGGDWYRVIDESGEDYLYPATAFEIVEQESRQVA